MAEITQPEMFDLDHLPEDFKAGTMGSGVTYKPIEPSEMYQVEIVKIGIKANKYYDMLPKEQQTPDRKYNVSVEFAILNDGEFYGRRLWQDCSPKVYPARDQYQATTLYKIINAVFDSFMDKVACESFSAELSENLKTLVGKQVKVAIENIVNPETNKTRSKIKTFYPVKKQMPKFDAEKSKAMGEMLKAGIDIDAVEEGFDKFMEGKVD